METQRKKVVFKAQDRSGLEHRDIYAYALRVISTSSGADVCMMDLESDGAAD